MSQGETFTLASISYLAILVKYILAKKKKKCGQYALRHGIQISMEAILACHPALSTE